MDFFGSLADSVTATAGALGEGMTGGLSAVGIGDTTAADEEAAAKKAKAEKIRIATEKAAKFKAAKAAKAAAEAAAAGGGAALAPASAPAAAAAAMPAAAAAPAPKPASKPTATEKPKPEPKIAAAPAPAPAKPAAVVSPKVAAAPAAANPSSPSSAPPPVPAPAAKAALAAAAPSIAPAPKSPAGGRNGSLAGKAPKPVATKNASADLAATPSSASGGAAAAAAATSPRGPAAKPAKPNTPSRGGSASSSQTPKTAPSPLPGKAQISKPAASPRVTGSPARQAKPSTPARGGRSPVRDGSAARASATPTRGTASAPSPARGASRSPAHAAGGAAKPAATPKPATTLKPAAKATAAKSVAVSVAVPKPTAVPRGKATAAGKPGAGKAGAGKPGADKAGADKAAPNAAPPKAASAAAKKFDGPAPDVTADMLLSGGASPELAAFVGCFLPLGEKSSAGEAKRKEAFNLADPNGNGLCSLAELEGFILNTLLSGNPSIGRDLWDLFRPSYIRAFNDAKDYKADSGAVIDGTKSATADDFVSKGEFRLFNAYLCIYAAMYDGFSKIDGGGAGRGGDDRKITTDEWMAGYQGLAGSKFVALSGLGGDAAATEVFRSMDDNGGGVITLVEWCEFIKAAEIAAGTAIGQSLAEDEEGGGGGGGGGKKGGPNATPGVSPDLVDFVQIFGPFAEKTDAGAAMRKKGFSVADPNGNGLCSLAELEGFILNSVMAAHPGEKGRNLFDLFRPSYIRAFTDAKDYKADDGTVLAGTKNATADDFVSKGEFRLFCTYLCTYAVMYDAFSKIDGGGAGRGGDDRKITTDEWMAGYKGVSAHGFVALSTMESDAAAMEVFRSMDANGGGVLTLEEWCEFIKASEIAAGTDIGLSLAEDEDASAAAGGADGDAKAAKAPAVATSSGLSVGASSSKEFQDIIKVFQPLAEKTAEAEKLRGPAFAKADPNGNGLCSLAELETYVLGALLSAYPKTKGSPEERGRDIFNAFRPCYIRAFNDAKDYKADTGAKIKGTKKATDDDFVSKEEFRLFNAYVCIYAAMFDAFAKVDGGGAGRDAKDDRRMDLEEWIKGYKGVFDYGFVALSGCKNKQSATELFQRIDANGGGIVLLEEWCEFLKAAEIEAGTVLGQTLAEDEEGGVGKKWIAPKTSKAPISESGSPKKGAKTPKKSSWGSGSTNRLAPIKKADTGPSLPPEATLSPLQRRKTEQAELKAKSLRSAPVPDDRGVKRPQRVGGVPGGSVTVKKDPATGEWEADTERDDRINLAAMRRLEVKVRTRKLLARKEKTRGAVQASLDRTSQRITHFTTAVDFDAVRTDLRKLMGIEPMTDPSAREDGDGDGGSSSGLRVGKSASKELQDIIKVFQPLAEKTSDAEAARDAKFGLADPNGNGLCSLAELEGFIQKALLSAYPKTKEADRGRDLFSAFRPCYIRAFNDAKDYKADTGAKIKGTKKATDDDYVSKEEFRLFNAYVCIYAAMYDGFSKIDGGGAGRDAKDDRRVDLEEWLKGYKGVSDYGFVAFASITDDASATAVFKQIDANGGGIVLLEEWCEFLKAAEIEAGTVLGQTLAEDEEGGVGKKWAAPKGSKPVAASDGQSGGGGGGSSFDPDGTIAPMLIRAAFNGCMTYDAGALDGDVDLLAVDPATGKRVATDVKPVVRPPSGGSNNCGLGGATMRFWPERDDPQNRGLNAMMEPIAGLMRAKHPLLSHADLWVLAAYVAVESCGGPVIPFTGGRFDAKSGDRCPFGDAPKLPPHNLLGSRLPCLDYGPGNPKGKDAAEREAPTIAHLREVAGRIGLTDREVVVLLLGCRGKKRGRPTAPAGDPRRDAAWAEEKLSFDLAWAEALLKGHWVEVKHDSNGKFPEALRPPVPGTRHFASLGEGYEALVEAWMVDGVALYPTGSFAFDLKAKGLKRLKAGESFVFTTKKMTYHTHPSDGLSYGVISYELSGAHAGSYVHDFDPKNPTLRGIKFTTSAAAMPLHMVHAQDMALCWDPGFKKWLDYYCGLPTIGVERLKEDFGLAFKRLTELGFQDSADEVPDYYTPRGM